MTDVTQPTPANAIDTFFANIKAEWQVFESDVISVIQNISAGVEVAAADLQYSLSWLGSHIGQIAQTVSAVQSSVNAISAAGVPIPDELTKGIATMNDAVAGVNAALNNEAVSASASTALTDGFQAAKALQAAAATASAIAATVQAATKPVA